MAAITVVLSAGIVVVSRFSGHSSPPRQAAKSAAAKAPAKPSAVSHGLALIMGRGVPADPARGLAELANEAANGREATKAAAALGELFLKGQNGIPASPGKANLYLARASADGDPNATFLMARAMLRGDGLPIEAETGLPMMETLLADKKREAAAAYELGTFFMRGGDRVAADPEKARKYLEEAIAAGHSYAPFALGRALLRGYGVAPDADAGMALLEKQIAAGKNIAAATYEIGSFYLKGNAAIPADPVLARSFLERSALAGSTSASTAIARAWLRGRGLPADPRAGIALLEKQIAEDKDTANAAYELGSFYLAHAKDKDGETSGLKGGDVLHGQLGPVLSNREKAIFYLKKAAATGDKRAAKALGRAELLPADKSTNANAEVAPLPKQASAGADGGAAAYRLGKTFLNGSATVQADPTKARSYLEQAMSAGHPTAGTLLGQALLRGKGLTIDAAAGVAVLKTQIESGRDVAAASYEIGAFYLRQTPPDVAAARPFLERSIKEGSEGAALALGRALLSSSHAGDVKTGLGLIEKQARKGKNVAIASYALGQFYLRGGAGVPADSRKARTYLGEAVSQGYQRAQFVLGQALLHGSGADPQAGIKMLQEQIAKGNDVGAAAYELGAFYLDGSDTFRPDGPKALAYLEQAIAAGKKDARLLLGRALIRGDIAGDLQKGAGLLESWITDNADRSSWVMIELGRFFLSGDPAVDPQKGRQYLERAADAGNSAAFLELASAELDGRLGTPDGAAAIAFYHQAMAAGSGSATVGLARVYLSGKGGIKQDARAGMQVLTTAADAGSPEAIRELISISLRGIRHQLSVNLGAARTWLDRYKTVADPDDFTVQRLLVEAADGSTSLFQSKDVVFRELLQVYDALPMSKRRDAMRQLFSINRNAAIFIAQTLLSSAGLYSGPVNGLFSPDTITAFHKACSKGGEGKCGSKSLHVDTVGFIALNFS